MLEQSFLSVLAGVRLRRFSGVVRSLKVADGLVEKDEMDPPLSSCGPDVLRAGSIPGGVVVLGEKGGRRPPHPKLCGENEHA